MQRVIGDRPVILPPVAMADFAALQLIRNEQDCVVVVGDDRVVGIVTLTDLLQAGLGDRPLCQVFLSEIMQPPGPLVVVETEITFWALLELLLGQPHNRLVLVDAQGQVQGVITPSHLQSGLPRHALLTDQNTHMATLPLPLTMSGRATARELAQCLVERRLNCVALEEVQPITADGVVIADLAQSRTIASRFRLVTAWDLLQCCSPGRSLATEVAQSLGRLGPSVSGRTRLWDAHQILLQRQLLGLPVVDAHESLIGLLTPTQVLRLFEAKSLLRWAETMVLEGNAVAATLRASTPVALSPFSSNQAEGSAKGGTYFTADADQLFHTQPTNGPLRALSPQLAAYLRSPSALEASRQAVENSPNPIFIVDQQGKIQIWNRACQQFFRRDFESVFGTSFRTLLCHGPEQEYVDRLFHEVLQGQSFSNIEISYRTGKDHCYQTVSRLYPIWNEQGQVVGAVFANTDITDRKRFEQALHESTQQLNRILESMTDAFFNLDAHWRFTYLNSQAEQLLLRDREQLMGQVIWEAFPATVGSIFEQEYRRAIADEVTVRFEAFYPPLDRWLEVQAHPSQGGLTVYFRDVTERRYNYLRLKQQAQRQQALNRVIQVIHQSLDLETIFSTAISEVGQLLQADRVGIARQLASDVGWEILASYTHPQPVEVAEASRPKPQPQARTRDQAEPEELSWGTQLGRAIQVESDQINPDVLRALKQGVVVFLRGDGSSDGTSTAPDQAESGNRLIAPLQIGEDLWGILELARSSISVWQSWEVELTMTIASQLTIAIHQSQMYRELQGFKRSLEDQVALRTSQLQQAFNFEATLKRITDRVRDSLDENHILQAAVEELAQAIGINGCNASLYDLEHNVSIVKYEYTTFNLPFRGNTMNMANFEPGYQQLLQGQYFQFCSLTGHPSRGRVVMLACPIRDNQGPLGDLWLIHNPDYAFTEQDIRLAQQVANQCAIAIRQSRLYQTAQAQVTELERLNQLKDDFLSTVSHELRTPMSNIKMATQMLKVSFERLDLQNSPTSQKVEQYLNILQAECQRETSLINDLLDLSRLEAGSQLIAATPINLENWLPQILRPFYERASQQHQTITVEIAPDLPPLVTDVSNLERIVGELMQNACKYTPPGEQIIVKVQLTTQTPKTVAADRSADLGDATAQHPTVPGLCSESNLVYPSQEEFADPPPEQAGCSMILLQVCNTGVELSPVELRRIFDKFYRVPHGDPWKHGGTGLGLALVKKLMEHLGGTICAESDRKQVRFNLQFPLQPLSD